MGSRPPTFFRVASSCVESSYVESSHVQPRPWQAGLVAGFSGEGCTQQSALPARAVRRSTPGVAVGCWAVCPAALHGFTDPLGHFTLKHGHAKRAVGT